jgi:hypothetical protein
MIGARVGAGMLDKAIYGREPVRAIETMSVEELEARFRIMRERAQLARWGGRALGIAGGAFGGLKLVALAAL